MPAQMIFITTIDWGVYNLPFLLLEYIDSYVEPMAQGTVGQLHAWYDCHGLGSVSMVFTVYHAMFFEAHLLQPGRGCSAQA